MKLFKREKAPSRSFEEITRPKDETQEENEEVETENEKKVETNVPKKATKGVPFNPSEFNEMSCFGWKEDRTDKWLAKCAKVWFLLMSFAWFVFGAITFAPILFISNKIDVLFNDRKKSLMCGIIIYVALIVLIVLLFASRGGGDASQAVNAGAMTDAITSETTEIMKMR